MMPAAILFKDDAIRKLAGRDFQFKQASPDADGNRQYEEAFADMAHASLQDRAPGLLDYEVGFQLLDRDDDPATPKAVGITAFKAGALWLYAPVFFTDGALKGKELLYVKNSNQFVPLKDSWVNYLLSKRPTELGTPIQRDSRQQGVRYPDMAAITQSPVKYAAARGAKVIWDDAEREALKAEADAIRAQMGVYGTKYASMPDWSLVGFDAVARAVLSEKETSGVLPAVISRSIKRAYALAGILEDYPAIRDGFERFYDRAEVTAAIKLASARNETRPVRIDKAANIPSIFDPRSRIELYTDSGDLFLRSEDVETIQRRGYLIKDSREDEEISHVYAAPVRIQTTEQFSNPTDSGLYDVIMEGGDTKKCFVGIAPHGGTGRIATALVAAVDGNDYCLVPASKILIGRRLPASEWDSWFDALPKFGGDSDSAVAGVGARGECTAPMRYSGSEFVGSDMRRIRDVSFCTCATTSSSDRAGFRPEHDDRAYFDRERSKLVIANMGSHLQSHAGTLTVPKAFKQIKLGYGRLRLGTLADAEHQIRKYAQDLDLKAVAPDEFQLDSVRLKRGSAVWALVYGYGLDEAGAESALDTAAKIRRGEADVQLMVHPAMPIKRADDFMRGGAPYMRYGPMGTPTIPEPMSVSGWGLRGEMPGQAYQQQLIRAPSMAADPHARDEYLKTFLNPEPNIAGTMEQAATNGSRELFDASAMTGMLKAVSPSSMVDDDIKDASTGLNGLGRLLFKSCWHRKAFADRYGDAEMKDLEESIRNTFDQLGETTLALKRKTVDPSPEETSQATNLSPIAEQ
jgi:hypothetical protein